MTDEERLRQEEAKERATARLQDELPGLARYRLGDIDARLEAYVRGVAEAPSQHCVWEQLAVIRFLEMERRYGVRTREVWRFLDFYESLHFPGKLGERRYELTPPQVFQYASIFGFWQGDRRVVRTAVLFVPRKFSKTTSSAALAVYDLLYGDCNAESYVGANSQDQARKCFDAIRGAMRRLDPNGRRFRINAEEIRSLVKGRTAFAQCLTSSAKTKDGLNASTVIMDEFSQARDAALLNVLTTSMGVRDNPLTVIITTASEVFDGPFYAMLRGYKDLLLGDGEDDSVFLHLFEPDIGDAEGDEATWVKVHPHMGVTVSLDFYRGEWRKAQRDGAEAMLAFRTKLLNVYAENRQRSWIGAEKAREVSAPMSLEDLRGRPAMVAMDLSERDDFSALTVAAYDPATSGYDYYTEYFFPEGALAGHPNEKLYRKWAAEGWLRLTLGDVIDYQAIVGRILEYNLCVKVRRVGYDPWKSREAVNMLATAVKSKGGSIKSTIVPIRQTYGYFTAPVESFEHGVFIGRVRINANPINFYCFGNAVLDYDNLENCKPVKRAHHLKIDGVVTMLMATSLFISDLR